MVGSGTWLVGYLRGRLCGAMLILMAVACMLDGSQQISCSTAFALLNERFRGIRGSKVRVVGRGTKQCPTSSGLFNCICPPQ